MKESKKIDTINLIEHVRSILCTNYVIDQESNNISLFNIVEKLKVKINKDSNIKEKILKKDNYQVLYKMEMVSWFRKKNTNINNEINLDIRMDLIDENNNVIVGGKLQEVKFPPNFKNLRFISHITSFFVPGTGSFYFVIFIRKSGEKEFIKIDRVPIDVEVI